MYQYVAAFYAIKIGVKGKYTYVYLRSKMDKESNKKDGIKIVFSLISLFLMVPLLLQADTGYYRTLFIFLINRVIDMFFDKNKNEKTFLVVWSLINQWAGVVACAVAFCSIDSGFASVFQKHKDWINIGLLVAVVSCVLEEMTRLIFQSVKEQLIREKIKNEVNQLEGERLCQE